MEIKFPEAPISLPEMMVDVAHALEVIVEVALRDMGESEAVTFISNIVNETIERERERRT